MSQEPDVICLNCNIKENQMGKNEMKNEIAVTFLNQMQIFLIALLLPFF